MEEDNPNQEDVKPKRNQVRGVFETLGSAKLYFLGAIAFIIVFGTVGFFIVLSIDKGTSTEVERGTSSSAGFTNTLIVNTNPIQSSVPQPSRDSNVASITSQDHIRGDITTASVIVIEFSDTECPFCKQFHATMQQVVDMYDGRVAWVYRHFPIDSLHSKARKESEATECAADLGGNVGFWAYVDRLFEVTPSNDGLDPSMLTQIATDIGLAAQKFQTCLDSGKYSGRVEAHYQNAIASGGTGTPYSVIISSGGEIVPISGAQPISSMKGIIDPLLQSD